MAKQADQKGSGKIAAYVAKYSNASSGAGYKGAVESFLRSVYHLDKQDSDGKKLTHNYEVLLDQYLADGKRNNSQDVMNFNSYMKKNSKSGSMQSVRQQLTYCVKFLNAQGIVITKEFVQDLKRETKGSAATVAKALSSDMICRALQGASVRDRAIILTLASSGLRIGELLSLDMSDIELTSVPVKITIRAAKAKNKHTRFTYCSQEATDAINAWIQNRSAFLAGSAKHNQNLINIAGQKAKTSDKVITTAPVQTASTLLFPVSDAQVNASWETCLKKAGLFLKDKESKRNIYRLHSLRKFFDTKLSNTTMPEKLVQYFEGHLSELANKYYIPSEDFASAEYLKAMDVLTCCTPERVQATIQTLKIETAELKKQDATQYESIEWLRDNNTKLQERLKKSDAKLDEQADSIGMMQEQMALLLEHYESWQNLRMQPGQSYTVDIGKKSVKIQKNP